jgi:hypothetical protein
MMFPHSLLSAAKGLCGFLRCTVDFTGNKTNSWCSRIVYWAQQRDYAAWKKIIISNDLTSFLNYNNIFFFEGAIRLVAQVRPFTRSYFFGLTQKVTKKVKASSSPFLLVQEFFSFAVLRPVRRSPYLSLRRSFRSFRPRSPHPAALQESVPTGRGDVWPGVCFV